MKRLGVFVLMIAVLLTLTACKRQAVKDIETAIDGIGTVSLESGASISQAEQLLEELTEEEKEDVVNLHVLAEARENYERLVAEKISSQLTCGEWIDVLANLEKVDKATTE